MKNIMLEEENFSQNLVTFHIIVVDVSGSMEGQKEVAVRNCLKLIQETLLSLEDVSSTRVAVIKFGDSIYPSNLKMVEKFSTNFSSCGESTSLYDAIVYVKNQIKKLHETYREKYRIVTNMVVLSDGDDNNSRYSFKDAKIVVETLKQDLNTACIFYAIEESRYINDLTKRAKYLGFEVKTVSNTKESLEKMSRQMSHMLQTSSQNGTLATLNTASVSVIASKEFKEKMKNVEVDTFDPFADVFE